MELQNHENLVAHVYACNIHKYIIIYKHVHKFMHMYHEYESVCEYGSNAFELISQYLKFGIEYPNIPIWERQYQKKTQEK